MRGLDDGIGYIGLEVVPHQNHVEGAHEEGGNNHGEDRVTDVENLRVDDVGWHQAAVKQHGEEHQKRNDVAALQLGTGQRIGKSNGKHHIADGTHNGDEEGHAISAEHSLAGPENVLVRAKAEFLREEGIAVGGQHGLVCERGHNQQQQGQHAHQ